MENEVQEIYILDMIYILRSLDKYDMHNLVSQIVFEEKPEHIGEIINNLDMDNPLDIRIFREFMSSILLLVSSVVDSNIRSKKPFVFSPSEITECFRVNLESFYNDANLKIN